MAYLGLAPSERSSGVKTLRGRITKAGNARARRVLVESAWTYRLPARVGAQILERNEDLPQPIKDIAWKAQVRLCARHRGLIRAGKPSNLVNVAIARDSRPSYGRSPRTTTSQASDAASRRQEKEGQHEQHRHRCASLEAEARQSSA